MEYLCLVYLDEERLDELPDSECLTYDAAIRKSGHCIASEALQSVETETTVRVRNGKVSVTDGTGYPMTGVYQEIVKLQRLAFTSAPLDKEGNPLFEVLNIVTFAEQNGKTTQTLQARIVKSNVEAASYLDGMEEGWTLSLGRLANHLTTAVRGNPGCPRKSSVVGVLP